WGRPAPGTPSGVEAAAPEDLRAFFREHYQPRGAILAVAGALDWPVVRDAVGRLFGDWPARPEPALATGPAGPRRGHIIKETQQIQVALAFPCITVDDPDYYLA